MFQVTHDDHIFKELSCKYKCFKNPGQGQPYIMQSHSFPAFLTDPGPGASCEEDSNQVWAVNTQNST